MFSPFLLPAAAAAAAFSTFLGKTEEERRRRREKGRRRGLLSPTEGGWFFAFSLFLPFSLLREIDVWEREKERN